MKFERTGIKESINQSMKVSIYEGFKITALPMLRNALKFSSPRHDRTRSVSDSQWSDQVRAYRSFQYSQSAVDAY